MDDIKEVNSIFEQPWWLDIVAHGRWSETVVKDKKSEIIARLPFVYNKSVLGTSIIMPPHTQTLGPWLANREFKRGNSHLGEEKVIVDELLRGLPTANNIDIALDSANKYVLPYYWHMFRISPEFSYRIANLENLDGIYACFHKSLQKNLRKADSACRISYESDVDLLYRMIEITFRNQNRKAPVSKEMVRNIVETCDAKKHGKMFVSRDHDNNVQVAAYMIFDEKVAYAILSGSDPRYRNSYAKSLIYWEEIKYAAKVSKAFDFEGSMVEGIENIMRQFGGRQVVYYHVSKLGIFKDVFAVLKPRIKKLIGYKI